MADQEQDRGGWGSFTDTSPEAIRIYLEGVSYPCSRDDLIQQARENDAPDDILYILNELEDRDYNDSADVAEAVNEVA